MKYSFNFGKSCYNKDWDSVAHQLGGATVVAGEVCASYAIGEAFAARTANNCVHIKAPNLPEGSQWQRNVLNSFKSASAVEKTYGGGTTFYRVGGQNGGFWSLDAPPLTEYQWRVDFAIKQEFCNDASTLYTLTIPNSSSITGLSGVVGPQGMGLYGGAHQIYIDYKSIPSNWIKTSPTNFIQ